MIIIILCLFIMPSHIIICMLHFGVAVSCYPGSLAMYILFVETYWNWKGIPKNDDRILIPMLCIVVLKFIRVFRYSQDMQGNLTKTGYILWCVPTVLPLAVRFDCNSLNLCLVFVVMFLTFWGAPWTSGRLPYGSFYLHSVLLLLHTVNVWQFQFCSNKS